MSNSQTPGEAIDEELERIDELDSRVEALEDRDPRGEAHEERVGDGSIDPDGDLAAQLDEFLGDVSQINERVVLPAGTYEWNSELKLLEQFDRLEIVGEPRATLAVRDHDVDLMMEIGDPENQPPRRFGLHGIEVDISDDPDRDCGIVQANAGLRSEIEDVRLNGQRNRRGPHGGDRFTILNNMRWIDGVGRISNVTLPDGDTPHEDNGGSVGHAIPIAADPPHNGTNIWDGCYVGGFIDNGIYTANSPGKNTIRNCTAVNNGGTNIRPGTNDHVRDCWIVIDNASEREYNGAGLWLNGKNATVDGLTIQAPEALNDLIRANSSTQGGSIKDVHVEVGEASQCRVVRLSGGEERVTLEDVTIRDSSEASYRGDFSVHIQRPATLRGLDVESARAGVICSSESVRFDGADVTGVDEGLTLGADDVSFTDTDVHSGGFAVGSNVDRDSLRSNGGTNVPAMPAGSGGDSGNGW